MHAPDVHRSSPRRSLRTEVLFTEPRWVALPAAHPLATRDVIGSREDFALCCRDNSPGPR